MVKYLGSFEFTNSGSLKTFAWSSDNQYLAIVISEGVSGKQHPRNDRVNIWNMKSLKRTSIIEGDRNIRRIMWLSKTEIVTQSESNQILWEFDSNEWKPNKPSPVNLIFPEVGPTSALSHDNKWITQLSGNSTVSIIDVSTSSLMGSIELPTYSSMQPNIKSVQWSPVGDRISVLIYVQKHERE